MTHPRPPHDEGITPIIAVLLMVSITVVLGAVVFVMAKDFGKSSDPPLTIQFVRDTANGKLTVARTDPGIDLTYIEVRADIAAHFAYNGQAGLGATAAPAGSFVKFATSPGADLSPGDYIAFCLDGSRGDSAITIRVQSPTSRAIYDNSLTNLSACT
jgi:flagellin-like protein